MPPTRYCTVCCEEINLSRLPQGKRYKARRCQTCLDANRPNGGKPHCVHCKAELSGCKWSCTPLCEAGRAALDHKDMKVPIEEVSEEYRRRARMTAPRPAPERAKSQQSQAKFVEAPTPLTESGTYMRVQAFPIEPKKRPRRRVVNLGFYESLREK